MGKGITAGATIALVGRGIAGMAVSVEVRGTLSATRVAISICGRGN